MKDKKVKIFAHPVLLFGGLMSEAFQLVICIITVILLEIGFYPANSKEDKIGCQVIFIIIALGVIVGTILCLPRWLVRIEFSEDAIVYHSAFTKAVKRSYNYYPYIYKAWYFHGGVIPIGYRAIYIVLSQKVLSPAELEHINQVAISDSVIKIRYSKRVYDKLLHVLPQKHLKQLKNCFSDE